MPPPSPREFRAAWVATVANIDWPSKPGLDGATMQQEMLTLLDRARTIGLNAIVLQVRPACDAIYPSRLEPWSEFISGVQGEAPVGFDDPLAAWVREAHRRGLELHAWFNPYRARHSGAKSPLASGHIARQRPQLVREYGNQLWLDPGDADAAAHTLAVVEDVLRRYDVDGVHIDDYFYPYPVPVPGAADGAEQPFPDDVPFQRYLLAGGTLGRDDWRRDNVNRLVQSLHALVRRVRPQARLGISPFGLPRPDLRPEGILGFSQYDKLYADVEHWVSKGWFDYLVPQLYWPIDRKAQAFAVLLDYWTRRVAASEVVPRHHWPGLFTSSIARAEGSARSWKAEEVLNQVALVREAAAPSGGGHVHFSMIALLQDRDGIASRLRAGLYRHDALPPASPWLNPPVAQPPRLQRASAGVTVTPQGDASQVLNWSVWRREAGRWRFASVPGVERLIPALGADVVVVSAVGSAGQESERVSLRLTAPA